MVSRAAPTRPKHRASLPRWCRPCWAWPAGWRTALERRRRRAKGSLPPGRRRARGAPAATRTRTTRAAARAPGPRTAHRPAPAPPRRPTRAPSSGLRRSRAGRDVDAPAPGLHAEELEPEQRPERRLQTIVRVGQVEGEATLREPEHARCLGAAQVPEQVHVVDHTQHPEAIGPKLTEQ